MAGLKRTSPEADHSVASKKRKIILQHRIRHKQASQVDSTLAPQNEELFDNQLFRAITVILGGVGFDGVTPTALQSFKDRIEEYMLHLCGLVKLSMTSCRRLQPIPQDFAYALSHFQITSSSLLPQIEASIPNDLIQPELPPPLPAEPELPNLNGMLGPELSGDVEKSARSYIPSHFPDFPSKDTWHTTEIFTPREKDPRVIREKATAEGIMAEKALRKLMTANKPENRRGRRNVVGEPPASTRQKEQAIWEDAMAAITAAEEKEAKQAQSLREEMDNEMDNEMGMEIDFGLDGAMEPYRSQPVPIPEEKEEPVQPMLVNYDRRYWRKIGQMDQSAS